MMLKCVQKERKIMLSNNSNNDDLDEGEGDCNHDHDCEGSLICGNNNCNKKVYF